MSVKIRIIILIVVIVVLLVGFFANKYKQNAEHSKNVLNEKNPKTIGRNVVKELGKMTP